MKKGSFVVFFIIVICFIFFVGCIDLIIGLKPPAPSTPQIGNMSVTLSWSKVDKATSYLLSINTEASGQEVRDVTFPVEKVVNGTTYNWTPPAPGTYSWKVRAMGEEGASRWINGKNFTIAIAYDNPVVTITYPSENQVVDSRTPTMRWTAVPGTLTSAPSRGYEIAGCDVAILQEGQQIHTGSGVKGTGNAWSYQLPSGVLDYSETYTLKVTATQEGAVGPGEDEKSFKAPSGIGLELSNASMYNCGIVTATVTAYDPDVDKVALFGKLQAQQDYIQIAPPDGWRELDGNRQAVFTFETKALGVGNWLINAQSLGSASKSTEKSLQIKKIQLVPDFRVSMDNTSINNGDYVYIDSETGFPATAVYTIDVTPDQQIRDIISEFSYTFEFAGAETVVITGPSKTFNTWQPVDIPITMATECTKNATLTLFGTSVCNGYYNTHTFEPITRSFTLDAALPNITIDPHQFGSQQESLTIPVHLEDTKSLCQATLSFFVEKTDAQGNQMPGWEIKEVPWGVETVTIGTGNNRITGEITYSDPIVFGETTSVNATALLNLGELDGATVTLTVTAIDSCGQKINVFSNGVVREAVSQSVNIFFDNLFYKKDFVNISFYDNSVYPNLGNSWLITSQNNPGQATFSFTDAYIDDLDDLEINFTGSIDAITPSGDSSLESGIIAECTGNPLKNEIRVALSLTALDNKETWVEAEFVATDQNGNTTELTQRIMIDTQPPILSSADGHLGQSAGNSGDDYVELAFRVADKGQYPEFSGATVTVDGDENKRQWYQYLGSVSDYGEQRGIVRLNEDHQFRVNFDETSYGLNVNGTVSIEVNAWDKYGNTGYTSVTGNVFNP